MLLGLLISKQYISKILRVNAIMDKLASHDYTIVESQQQIISKVGILLSERLLFANTLVRNVVIGSCFFLCNASEGAFLSYFRFLFFGVTNRYVTKTRLPIVSQKNQ